MNIDNRKKIVVAGGGPAGMMAAIRAGELGREVVLVEKNLSLGKKLLITGNSRCNLTNTYDLETFISRIPGNGDFLRSAFKRMFNKELVDFFEKRGVSFVTEKGYKIFPSTSKAMTILDVLIKELKRNKVKLFFSSEMADVIVEDSGVRAVLLKDGSRIVCDSIVIATGGITYPGTGSTGDGIRIAKKTGHLTVSPRPALAPMETVENYPAFLEGLTCGDIRIKFINESRKKIVSSGDLIFTAFGISGPVVMSLSGKVSDWLENKSRVYAEIDLMPGITEEQTEVLLLDTFNDNPGKSIKNALKNILSSRVADLFISISGIDPDKKTGNINRNERKKIIVLIKKFTMEINKIKGLTHAMITRGGVSLKDIDPRTMCSRKIPNLYFAGELLDIDGDTGGFNLQIAFSTGYLAGESAAKLSRS